ncbi:MAG: class I SAM-dependent methyltransferase [Planctomycetia bacterium]|nr:class I SAM-dependent methyltransferase [Planctomycetia bacterium]
MIPDWKLPPGVDRPLWDYVHNESLAHNYDAGLADSSLFRLDLDFVRAFAGSSGRLIDLGCGTGRLLAALDTQVWTCVGVDLSASMLGIARQKVPSAHLVQANLTQLEAFAPQSFDAAVCLFSTLGMVRGESERRRVIAGTYRLLRPGGRFILHVHNRWFHLWNSAGRAWLLSGTGERVMPAHQGVTGLTLYQFTRREVIGLLATEGFRTIEVHPISIASDGRVMWPWLWPGLRAYGYLIAAERC